MQSPNIVFPTKENCIIIAIALKANGDSSYRDAKHITHLTSEKWSGKQFVISDRQGFGQYVHNKQELLEHISQIVKEHSKNCDILFCLSAHGYTTAKDQYVRVGNEIVLDHEMRNALYEFMDEDTLSLSLVDTCHSGLMLDLPSYSKDGIHFQKDLLALPCVLKPKSFCISACANNEVVGEDISDFYGFGGKLSSYFLDYLHPRQNVNIFDFYKRVLQVFSSQSQQRTHPIISCS